MERRGKQRVIKWQDKEKKDDWVETSQTAVQF